MRSFLISFLASLAWNMTALADDDKCAQLAQSTSLTFEVVPPALNAGSDLSYVARVTVDDVSLLDGWDHVVINISFGNDIVGSNRLYFEMRLKEDGIMQPFDLALTDKVRTNMIGVYRAEAQIFGFGRTSAYCGKPLNRVQDVSVEISDDPKTADIDPPIIANFASDKLSYVRGDQVLITFDATDKSGICTSDLHDQGACHAVPHVALQSLSGDAEINASAPVEKIGELYGVRFAIPSDTEVGEYELVIVNTYDIYENSFNYLTDKQKIRVSVVP